MNKKATPGSRPEETAEDATPERGRPFGLELPDGWVGIFLLLIVAAVSGGLIAGYWPTFMGGDGGATQDRIAALETRLGQIAAGRAGAAASGVFDDLRREIASLSQRIDANEARLTGLETTSGETGAPVAGNLAPLQQKLDAASTALADVTARLAKLEAAQGSAADVSGLTAKLTALDARIGKLEEEIARSSQTLSGTLSGMETRLKAMEANAPPADLAQRLDSYALKTTEAGIEARLRLLEAQNSGESLHRAATMLALTQLAHAANGTSSFQLQLDTYAAASPGDPMVELLKPYAKTGVPSRAALSARFPDAARSALDAERNADARSLFSKFWANVLSLVSVRRVGEAVGDDTESKLARAQARLDANDLAAAAREVRNVRGVAAKSLANWLRDAFARLTLDRAVADMAARVIQALAGPPPVPAPTAEEPAPAQGGQP